MLWLAIALALLCGWLGHRIHTITAESAKRLQDTETARASLASLSTNYHEKLRAVSATSGAGIIMVDEQGRVLHTNDTADQILGCEPSSIVGKALIQATMSAELQEFVIRTAAEGQSAKRDFETPGAPPRILRATVYPFQQGLSGYDEAMLILQDVTQLKKLETLRRDFVANVSHELRTPLASMRAMAETLQDGALDDPEVAQRFLGTIIKEADRLARIAEDLLILANAESQEPIKEPFDLARLLEEIMERQRPQAFDRALGLRLSVPDKLPVSGARDQLEQVFVNLIDNAIKYTPPSERIEVIAEVLPSSVRVQVKDSGIGMLQEHLPRIFERFYRVDKARSRESGGTGLGLSIVKNIVEAHGGSIGVSSQFNHGTTFTVSLPRNPEEPSCQ